MPCLQEISKNRLALAIVVFRGHSLLSDLDHSNAVIFTLIPTMIKNTTIRRMIRNREVLGSYSCGADLMGLIGSGDADRVGDARVGCEEFKKEKQNKEKLLLFYKIIFERITRCNGKIERHLIS